MTDTIPIDTSGGIVSTSVMANFKFTIDGMGSKRLIGNAHHLEIMITPDYGVGYKPEKAIRIIGMVKADGMLELRASMVDGTKKYIDLSRVLIIESNPFMHKDAWEEFEKKHGRKPSSYEEVFGEARKAKVKRNRVLNGRKDRVRDGIRYGVQGRNVLVQKAPDSTSGLDTGKTGTSLEGGHEGVGDMGAGGEEGRQG